MIRMKFLSHGCDTTSADWLLTGATNWTSICMIVLFTIWPSFQVKETAAFEGFATILKNEKGTIKLWLMGIQRNKPPQITPRICRKKYQFSDRVLFSKLILIFQNSATHQNKTYQNDSEWTLVRQMKLLRTRDGTDPVRSWAGWKLPVRKINRTGSVRLLNRLKWSSSKIKPHTAVWSERKTGL